MPYDLTGRRALVTGATSGLGRHFAQVLAAAGATVVLAARRPALLDETRAALAALGGRVEALTLDVADAGAVAAALPAAGEPFDIVLNNAGITGEGAARDMTQQSWEAVMGTNLSGLFRVAQAAANQMIAAGRGGSIVNVASITGHRIAGGYAAYSATKAAVLHLTRALAFEWARYGIRVNALSPGYVETGMNRGFFDTDAGKAMIRRIPQRRIGRAEELDGALMLLCSDASSYMTGSDIVVDGGHLVSTL